MRTDAWLNEVCVLLSQQQDDKVTRDKIRELDQGNAKWLDNFTCL